MSEWWSSVVTVFDGIVVKTVFRDTSSSGAPLWDTFTGEGYEMDGQVFFTGSATSSRSMGVTRDYVHHSVVVSLGGPIG